MEKIIDPQNIDWLNKENFFFINTKYSKEKRQQYLAAYNKYLKTTNFESCIFIASSATGGKEKIYALKKEAFLISAEAVCKHSNLKENFHCLCPLPLHHVGGLAIYARAYLTKQSVSFLEKWSLEDFYKKVQEVHYTSLVPTQVFDIVEANLKAPKSLETVFVGGDHLDKDLYLKALSLGWPLYPSYGATEFCSQIATATKIDESGDYQLELLPHIKAKANGDNEVFLKSKSLFHSFWDVGEEKLFYPPLSDEGFYRCEDKALLKNNTLQILGRDSDYIKIMGEALSLYGLKNYFSEDIKQNLSIIPIEDKRRAYQLYLVIEGEYQKTTLEAVKALNQKLEAYKKIEGLAFINSFPRSELGKIKKKALKEMLLKQKMPIYSIKLL